MDEIDSYVANFIALDNTTLTSVSEQERIGVNVRPSIGPEVGQTLEGPFDLIFQDSDKRLYPVLLERCIELTRHYGLIVADDALFKPLGRPDPVSAPIHSYNQKVFSDRRLYSTLLPVGDGVTLSVKVKS